MDDVCFAALRRTDHGDTSSGDGERRPELIPWLGLRARTPQLNRLDVTKEIDGHPFTSERHRTSLRPKLRECIRRANERKAGCRFNCNRLTIHAASTLHNEAERPITTRIILIAIARGDRVESGG